MYKLYYRSFQRVMKFSMKFLPWRDPRLIVGENSLRELPALIQQEQLTNILIVTDKGIEKAGLMNQLLVDLQASGIEFVIYNETVANPTIENIEEALKIYKLHNCQGIVAFGGGSPIDCAKGLAARIARPHKSIDQMRGLLKVNKKIPTLITVPTTAGTGSEATLACVVSNSVTKEKYALMDPALIPTAAILDPLLTIDLPKHITATTGMDALTNAVEAYIGRSNTKETERWSVEAIKLIFKSLVKAYQQPNNLKARTDMLIASYFAGKAFTRAYVGNVHAIAHTVSGFYDVPHGLANAVLLPKVLEFYGDSVHKRLAELADELGISKETDSDEEKAVKFISAIKEMNKQMEITTTIDRICAIDIPTMTKRAVQEANPLYPVPKVFMKADMEKVIGMIM